MRFCDGKHCRISGVLPDATVLNKDAAHGTGPTVFLNLVTHT